MDGLCTDYVLCTDYAWIMHGLIQFFDFLSYESFPDDSGDGKILKKHFDKYLRLSDCTGNDTV